MSVFTFTSAMLSDLSYRLDDQDILNDVMIIDGLPGFEQLVRCISTGSIARYGRRSKKMDRPIAESAATAEDLVEEQLDRYCFETTNPMCRLEVKIPLITDALLIAVCSLKISDEVTFQIPVMGLNKNFYVDDISLDISTNQSIAELGVVEKAYSFKDISTRFLLT